MEGRKGGGGIERDRIRESERIKKSCQYRASYASVSIVFFPFAGIAGCPSIPLRNDEARKEEVEGEERERVMMHGKHG